MRNWAVMSGRTADGSAGANRNLLAYSAWQRAELRGCREVPERDGSNGGIEGGTDASAAGSSDET